MWAEIISVDGCGALTLQRVDMTLRVRLSSPGLVAGVEVDMRADDVGGSEPWAELASFFRDLAKNWMDSARQLQYGAADEAFGLSCDWDAAGHFHLHIRMREVRHAKWSVTGMVELELGTLDEIFIQVAKLVGDGFDDVNTS